MRRTLIWNSGTYEKLSSGATALIYEVVWSKYLSQMFGSTIYAQTRRARRFHGWSGPGQSLVRSARAGPDATQRLNFVLEDGARGATRPTGDFSVHQFALASASVTNSGA